MSDRRLSLLRLGALLCVAAGPLALLNGCSNMLSTAAADNSVNASTAGISGIVHGGRQPISGATVTLWAAGNAGYGSAAASLATTTTDTNGNFSFHPAGGATYACPSTSSPTASQSIYITTSGGQPTTGLTNSAAALMVALGDCSTVLAANPSLDVDEVTTVASMFALQQFFSPSGAGLGNFGTSPTNITGLANAMATVNNLVNTSTGTANASTTASGTVSGYSTNPVVTITPEQSKIDTMADVLAACVNSSGTGAPCSTLFSDVNSTAALDTLQAAYYMAINPTSTVSGTSNLGTIFNLAVANSPFNPSLSSTPTDWTVGVTYGSNSSQTVSSTTVYLLTEPEYVAVDSNDNVWVASFKTTSLTAAGNSVTELNPLGVPVNQVLTAIGQIAGPRNLVIDPSNNVYVGSYGTSTNSYGKQLSEYTAGGATNIFPIGSGEDGLASDASGNIFIVTNTGTGGSADLEYLPAGSANGTSSTQLATGLSTANGAGTYSSLAIDSYHDLWLSNNVSLATTQFICTFVSTPSCSGTSTTAGGQTGSQSVSVDHNNNVWVGNYSGTAGSVSEIAATSTSTITGVAGSPFSGGGLLNPTRSIIDGLGNYWVTEYASNAGSVTEMTSAGAAVSPSAGFAHTFASAEGIAIDASGNVWIGNAGSGAAASATNNGFITEIVGQAAPVVNPLAAELPTTVGGANKLGTRP